MQSASWNNNSKMPYLIKSDHSNNDRMFAIDSENDDVFYGFYNRLGRGEQIDESILTLAPAICHLRSQPRKKPADISNVGSAFIVNEKVKGVVEELEESTHAFVPLQVDLGDKWGGVAKFYVLHVSVAINAIVIEETDFHEGSGQAGFEKSPYLSSFGKIVLKADRIKGRHLWRGAIAEWGKSVPFAHEIFGSDELVARLKEAGVSGWVFRECELE